MKSSATKSPLISIIFTNKWKRFSILNYILLSNVKEHTIWKNERETKNNGGSQQESLATSLVEADTTFTANFLKLAIYIFMLNKTVALPNL